jgi:hypothetical protein
MTKLELQSRNGDVIHNTLEMAKSVGYKCVARYWYDQTMPLSEGIDKISDDVRGRDDILCPIKHMGMGINSNNELVLEYIDGREFAPTPHAINQLASWCGVSRQFVKDMSKAVLNQNGTVKYERDQRDREVLLSVLQNGYRRIDPDKEFRFRTHSNKTLRAVLSKDYAIIDNVWYLETLANLFKTIGGDEPRLSHWKGDGDTIYGNLLIADTCREEDDSDYGGMISMSNCEIGTRRLSQTPSVFRAICMNGCIWDQNTGTLINKVHRGNIDLKQLRDNIAINIHSQIPLMQEGIDKFLKTKDNLIDKDVQLSKVFALIATENAMSVTQANELVDQFIAHEANNTNMFGLLGAITRAGQKFSNTDWVKFDQIAGNMMNYSPNQWNSFNARAKAMDQKIHDKAFGIVTAV